MSSTMPSVEAASPSSPPMRRVDSTDSLKTQVMRHELAIATSTVTPVRLQRPVPTAERREKDSPPHSRYDRDTPSSTTSASRKRTNTSQTLSPTLQKRRSNDSVSSLVLHEGKLSVVEQIEKTGSTAVKRSLGKIKCRIARQSRYCVMEMDANGPASIQLILGDLKLTYDPLVPSRHFTLKGAQDETGRVKSFSFTASSSGDQSSWIKELTDLTGDPSSSAKPAASPSAGSANASAHSRRQEREIMAGLAVNRPERPVKRGGLVYAIPPKMTHIILVRHGHYINAHAKNVSDCDQVLSQMGRQQAELTGHYLETLYHRCPARNQQVTLYHSDLTRAVETATVISKNIESSEITPQPSSLLREGWPGQPFATDQMPAHMLNRNEDEDKELDRLDLERMDEAYNKFFAENSDEDECLFRVLVCHANLIRYLLCRALRVDPNGVWGHFEINHCGVTRIDICRNRPLKVMAINETGHLPHSLTTSSEDHL